MALRLRKDVQKASYYVWFLGAEEARGLRGARILLSAIPYLVERARELEPIKVTLQVSHKGMKIIQGSSKHFITHSAITCSVQTDDIVACILLLYNPVTKCPLHVHAYRCDSESTAQALNQQMQVLINRPENQKRFAELETRLGLLANSPTGRSNQLTAPPLTQTTNASIKSMSKEKSLPRNEERPLPPSAPIKRFDSSLGSDTGTSTRESECSEEHSPVSPMSPISSTKASLYDSLAAELRAKLNGNGPPLLLPPRDYDTVHRSKGNLAATELRRCRNSLIVGVGGPGSKYGVSSRGSSGIGSDLAPSPERHELHSSSDEDWLEKKRRSDELTNSTTNAPPPRRQLTKQQYSALEKLTQEQAERLQRNERSERSERIERTERSSDHQPQQQQQQPPSYLYPLQKQSSHVSNGNAMNARQEEEIKPKLVRPRNLDFKQILSEKQFVPSDEIDEEDHDFNDDVQKFRNDSYMADKHMDKNKMISDSKLIKRVKGGGGGGGNQNDDDDDDDVVVDEAYRYRQREILGKYRNENRIDDDFIRTYRENLTDKQKYRESLMEKQRNVQNTTTHNGGMYRERQLDDGFRVREPNGGVAIDAKGSSKGSSGKGKQYGSGESRGIDETTVDRKAYRQKPKAIPGYDDTDFERNPYKEPDSLPYRESIERMIKSPAMRYKAFNDNNGGGSGYRGIEYDEERLSDDKDRFVAYPLNEKYREMRISQQYPNEVPQEYVGGGGGVNTAERMSSRQRYKEMKQRSASRSPDTVMRVPPKERFQNAKEKFKAIERDRPYGVEHAPPPPPSHPDRSYPVDKLRASRRIDSQPIEAIVHNGNQRHLPPRQDPNLDWSSDDEHFGRGDSQHASMSLHRQQQPPPPLHQQHQQHPSSNGRHGPPREHYEKNIQSRIVPSKSLGNLANKGGYRHSYAEPRNPMPRNSGRVGLAAVNPY